MESTTTSKLAPLTSAATTLTSPTEAPLTSATEAYKTQLITFLQIASGTTDSTQISIDVDSLTLSYLTNAKDLSKAVTLSQLGAITLYQSIVSNGGSDLALDQINISDYTKYAYYSPWEWVVDTVQAAEALAAQKAATSDFWQKQEDVKTELSTKLTTLEKNFPTIAASTVDKLFSTYLTTDSDRSDLVEVNQEISKIKALYSNVLSCSLGNIANSAFTAYQNYAWQMRIGDEFTNTQRALDMGERQITPISMNYINDFRCVIESVMIDSCISSIEVMSALMASESDVFRINPGISENFNTPNNMNVSFDSSNISAAFGNIPTKMILSDNGNDFSTVYANISTVKENLGQLSVGSDDLSAIISGEMKAFNSFSDDQL